MASDKQQKDAFSSKGLGKKNKEDNHCEISKFLMRF